MDPSDTPLALRLQKREVLARLFGEAQESTRVGRYALLRRIGAGGMGVVYSAYDDELDRKVALKLVAIDRLGAATVARVRREAQALARLSHPNVVHVYEVGEAEGHAFVAMEFVAGQTLRAYQEAPERSAEELLGVYAQAGRGLAAAHAAGLIHRDFKPDNALLGEDGRVRVVDFGLARLFDHREAEAAGVPSETVSEGHPPAAVDELAQPPDRLTASGALVGTPAYMSPEQLRGGEADARSDVFSFCAALYEALYGARPFAGADVAALRRAIEGGTIAAPVHGRDLPPQLREALIRGLAADPADRWPDMEALLDALGESKPERRWLALVIAAAVLVAAAALVAWALGERSRQETLEREQRRTQLAEAAAQTAEAATEEVSRRDRARRLVAASVTEAPRDPEAALLFAIEAVHVQRDAGEPVLAAAEQALRDALDMVGSELLVDPDGAAPQVRAALDPQGRSAATRDAGGVLRLWRLGDADAPGSPTLVRRWDATTPPTAGTDGGAMAFTADGERLIVAGEGAVAEVIEVDDPERSTSLATGAPVKGLLVSPEGQRALALATTGAHLLDLDLVASPRPLAGVDGHVLWAGFSPDGERLVTIESDGSAALWSARYATRLRELRGPGRPRRALRGAGAWGPSAARFALLGTDGIQLFDHEGQRRKLLRGGESPLVALGFTSDDVGVLGLNADGELRRWSEEGAVGAIDILEFDRAIGGVRFVPGIDMLLGTPFSGPLWLWSTDDRGGPMILRGHATSVQEALVDRSGARILSIAHEDPSARLWHLRDDPSVLRGHDGVVERVAFSPDGSRLLSAAMDGTARVWRPEGGPAMVLRRHAEASSVAAAWHPDGTMIATASSDGSARLWRVDGAEAELLASMNAGERGRPPGGGGFTELVWTPGGDRLVLAGDDGHLLVARVDAERGFYSLSDLAIGEASISRLALTPDGKTLLCAVDREVLRVDLSAEALDSPPPRVIAQHSGPVRDLRISKAGDRVASSGDDGQILIVQIRGDDPPLSLRDGPGIVWSIAFDPTGQRLLSGGSDGDAKIWELGPGPSLNPNPAPPVRLRGHAQAILSVAYAEDEDGDAILTTSADGAAMIWRRAPGEPEGLEWTPITLPHAGTRWPGVDDGSVWVGAFRPDATLVATGAADGAVRLFPLDVGPLLRLACARVGRELSDDERALARLEGTKLARCGRR